MTPFLDSFYTACACGFPCELTRRFAALVWARADAARHAAVESRALAPMWPFKVTW